MRDQSDEELKTAAQDAEREAEEHAKRPSFTVRDRRFWVESDEEADEAEQEHAKAPSYVETLQQQLEDKDRQLREYIAAYKQEVVDGLEKTKQRLQRDAQNRLEQQRGQVAQPMLEVLEAMERSLQAAEAGADLQGLLSGLKMVHLLMVQKLQELGLQRVPTVGAPFDPTLHEAISVAAVSDPAQHNVIIAEARPGFVLGERLLRAAQVVVGKVQD